MVRAASVPIPKFASPCNTLSCELRNQTLTWTPSSTSCSTTFQRPGGGFRAGMMGGGLRGGIVGGGFRSATVAGGFRGYTWWVRRVPHRFGHRRFAFAEVPFAVGVGLYGGSCWTWQPTPWGWQRLWACEAGLKCLGRKLREEGRLLYGGRVGIYIGRAYNSAPACSRLA
jgi:hypothetical protein